LRRSTAAISEGLKLADLSPSMTGEERRRKSVKRGRAAK
jgi:hypothetical protein